MSLVIGFVLTAAGLSIQLTSLVRFNHKNNKSETLPIFWAESPLNFLSQPEIVGSVVITWIVLAVANGWLSLAGRLGIRQTLCLVFTSTSGVLWVLWVELFLLHSYLGYDDFQPNPSYWWVSGLIWLAHMGFAVAAIVIFRSSMKKDLAD